MQRTAEELSCTLVLWELVVALWGGLGCRLAFTILPRDIKQDTLPSESVSSFANVAVCLMSVCSWGVHRVRCGLCVSCDAWHSEGTQRCLQMERRRDPWTCRAIDKHNRDLHTSPGKTAEWKGREGQKNSEGGSWEPDGPAGNKRTKWWTQASCAAVKEGGSVPGPSPTKGTGGLPAKES